MRRYFINPIHAGVAHGGVGVQATGDGVLNQDLFAFFEQGDFLFLNLHSLIYLCGFAVQKDGNGVLFGVGIGKTKLFTSEVDTASNPLPNFWNSSSVDARPSVCCFTGLELFIGRS